MIAETAKPAIKPRNAISHQSMCITLKWQLQIVKCGATPTPHFAATRQANH